MLLPSLSFVGLADDFVWCTTEYAAVPLLDVQAVPGLSFFAGLQQVSITSFSGADTRLPTYLAQYPVLSDMVKGCPDVAPPPPDCRSPVPVVSLNCSGAGGGCALDGLTIIASSGYEGGGGPLTAVRVFSGTVTAVTILDGMRTGAHGVLDAENRPVGSWVGRGEDGFVIVGSDASASRQRMSLAEPSAGVGKALLVGQAGQDRARFALGTDGSLSWAAETQGHVTTLLSQHSNATHFAPPSIAARGGIATTIVTVAGAEPGDMVAATYEGIGRAPLVVNGHVSAADEVMVVLRNDGVEAVKLPAALLRVVVSKYAPTPMGKARTLKADDSSHLDHFSFYCCEVFTGAHRDIPSNTTTSPLVSWSETYRRTANWTTSVMSYVTRSAQGSFADGAAVLGERYRQWRLPAFVCGIDQYVFAGTNVTGPCTPKGSCNALLSGWQSATREFVTALLPHIASGAVRGISIGDELCARDVPLGNISSVLRVVKQTVREAGLDEGLLTTYFNDDVGCDWSPWPLLDPNLDRISIDRYGTPQSIAKGGGTPDPATELLLNQDYINSTLFPRLRPHQKVILVPGTWASSPVGCREGNSSCPLAPQEARVVSALKAFMGWARGEPRISGMNPFHLGVVGFKAGRDTFEDSGSPPYDFAVGAFGMERVMEAAEAIGREIKAGRGS